MTNFVSETLWPEPIPAEQPPLNEEEVFVFYVGEHRPCCEPNKDWGVGKLQYFEGRPIGWVIYHSQGINRVTHWLPKPPFPSRPWPVVEDQR